MYLEEAHLDWLLGLAAACVPGGGRPYLFLKQLVTSSPLDRWYSHVSFLPLCLLA